MKTLIIFFIFFTTSNSFAFDAYDNNCVDLGKKWGWIKSAHSLNPSKKAYADFKKIKNDYEEVQKIQLKQIETLKLIEEINPCIGNHGMAFKNGIFMSSGDGYSTFRSKNSVLECDINIKNYELIKVGKTDLRLKDNRSIGDIKENNNLSSRENQGKKVIQAQYNSLVQKYNQYNKDRNTIFGSNSNDPFQAENQLLGGIHNTKNLDMINYCLNQLFNGIAKDKLNTAEGEYRECFYEKKGGCKKMAEITKNLKILKEENNDVIKTLPQSGYLLSLKKMDEDLFGPYRNNERTLSKMYAESKDKISYLEKNKIYKDIKNKSGLKDPSLIDKCGENNPLIDENFKRGMDCSENIGIKIDLEIDKINSVIHDQLREKLITELNLQAFSNAVIAKWASLKYKDPLKTKMYKNPEEGCRQIAKELEIDGNSLLCKEPYLKTFKKAVETAWNSSNNFLAYKTDVVSDYFNNSMLVISEFCEFYKGNNSGWVKYDQKKISAFKQTVNNLLKGQFSSYLYFLEPKYYYENLNNLVSSDDELCKGYKDQDHQNLFSYDAIEKARKVIDEKVNTQIKTIHKISKKPRDLGSNLIGQKVCEKGILQTGAEYLIIPATAPARAVSDMMTPADQKKESLLALLMLYKSNPYDAGRVLQNLPKADRDIFLGLICESKICDNNVKEFNDYVTSAAHIGAMALNLVPVAGQFLAAGASAAINITDAYRDKNRASNELDNMQTLISTSGMPYNKKISEVLNLYDDKASVEDFAQEVAKIIAEEAIDHFANKIDKSLTKEILKTKPLKYIDEGLSRKIRLKYLNHVRKNGKSLVTDPKGVKKTTEHLVHSALDKFVNKSITKTREKIGSLAFTQKDYEELLKKSLMSASEEILFE
jgi:hypothetical protein